MVGFFDVTSREGFSHLGRAHSSFVDVLGREFFDFEMEEGAEFTQNVEVAFAVAAEPVVVAHDDNGWADALADEFTDVFEWRHAGEVEGERVHDEVVEACFAQELLLFGKRVEKSEAWPFSLQNQSRVRMEGQEDGFGSEGSGARGQQIKDSPMTRVHAIERSDGQNHRLGTRHGIAKSQGVGVNLHFCKVRW
jgi:hypothetical protein